MTGASPAADILPPGVNPDGFCPDCGDLIAWCPIWVRQYPNLERLRD